MNKKFLVVILALMLVIITNYPLSSIKKADENEFIANNLETLYPDDLIVYCYSGGTSPWSTIFILEINMDGSCVYSGIFSEDRDTGTITIIDEFDLTSSQMEELWQSIQDNDFFNLEGYYGEEVSDGTTTYMKVTANSQEHTVESYNVAVPGLDNIIKTINSLTPGVYDLYNNALLNYPPNKPEQPSGELEGRTGREYTYSTQTIDANDDPIYYLFDWGDGTDSGWIGPYASSEEASAKKTWDEDGNYSVLVYAKDDPNVDGDLSDGIQSRASETQQISMPKTKHIFYQFHQSLSDLISYFPILDQIIQFLMNKDAPVIETVNHGGTTVTRDECEITVTIYIQIWGPGATDDLADEIESDIEDVWNTDGEGNSWFVSCEDDCERQEPGCSVEFDADVKKVASDEVLPGYHDILIREDTSGEGYSTVWVNTGNDNDDVLDWPRPNDQSTDLPHYIGGTTEGTWDNNEPDHTWAHEAGHLMGLDDTYTDTWTDSNGDGVMQDSERTSTPDAGHENDIMANLNGKPLQSAIDAIVDMSGVECPCDCCPEEEDDDPPENKILSPENGSEVGSTVIVNGYADDHGGSGIAYLDYMLSWEGGSYDGTGIDVDPPKDYMGYNLGPINLASYIDPGEWINISIIAIDDAGNSAEDSIMVTWVENQDDTIPPVTTKEIGEPNDEGGYIIWPQTPIMLHATDEGGSGVNYIYYEILWDMDMDDEWDETFYETVYAEDVIIFMQDYQIFYGLIQLSWYAVDNAQNVEETHIQEHMVMEGVLSRLLH